MKCSECGRGEEQDATFIGGKSKCYICDKYGYLHPDNYHWEPLLDSEGKPYDYVGGVTEEEMEEAGGGWNVFNAVPGAPLRTPIVRFKEDGKIKTPRNMPFNTCHRSSLKTFWRHSDNNGVPVGFDLKSKRSPLTPKTHRQMAPDFRDSVIARAISQLAFWGLMEPHPHDIKEDGNWTKQGHWVMTELGMGFLRGKVSIYEKVRLKPNTKSSATPIGYVGRKITVDSELKYPPESLRDALHWYSDVEFADLIGNVKPPPEGKEKKK